MIQGSSQGVLKRNTYSSQVSVHGLLLTIRTNMVTYFLLYLIAIVIAHANVIGKGDAEKDRQNIKNTRLNDLRTRKCVCKALYPQPHA